MSSTRRTLLTPPSLFLCKRKSIGPCVHANLLCVSRLLRPPRRVPPTKQPPICGRQESPLDSETELEPPEPALTWSLTQCSRRWRSCTHHWRRCSRRSRSSQNRGTAMVETSTASKVAKPVLVSLALTASPLLCQASWRCWGSWNERHRRATGRRTMTRSGQVELLLSVCSHPWVHILLVAGHCLGRPEAFVAQLAAPHT